MDDNSIIQSLGGAIMAAIAWFTKGAVSQVRTNMKDLADHKLHVSETYAKQADMASLKAEQINATNRLHDRIDGVAADIKTILSKVK